MNNMNKSKNIFTVIDIGNSKISCLIGTSVKTNDVQIKTLGFGQHASLGICNGHVTDMKEIANSIARAVESAEIMAGLPINNVICSLSGGRPITKIMRNEVKIEKGELRSKLLAIKKERESDEIYLRASKNIEYQKVATILALVSAIGYSQISLVTDVE